MGNDWSLLDASVLHCLDLWCRNFKASLPEGALAHKQRYWDRAAIDEGKAVLLSMANSPSDVARLLAVASLHAGDWLNALPISSCGFRLEDDVVRVGVGLRLGLQICESHRCVCDSMVDQLGAHALSCKFGIGRLSRHGMLNDIVHRAFTSAGIPAMKEPTGLVKGCALRPDGLTLIPWAEGRSLAWDVTVTPTLAPTNLVHSVHVAGSAAEAAADRKLIKYASLSHSHLFVPVAIETHGPLCKAALDLFAVLGRRISERTGDPREGAFLISKSLYRYPAWQRSGSPWQFR